MKKNFGFNIYIIFNPFLPKFSGMQSWHACAREMKELMGNCYFMVEILEFCISQFL